MNRSFRLIRSNFSEKVASRSYSFGVAANLHVETLLQEYRTSLLVLRMFRYGVVCIWISTVGIWSSRVWIALSISWMTLFEMSTDCGWLAR